MLKFYSNPVSGNARRVQIALLEKAVPFELIELKLDGDQLQSDFLSLNPFHHVPVLVDEDFRLIESIAILDYLEARYPTPPLLPRDAKDLALVRMVQLVITTELVPVVIQLASQLMGFVEPDAHKQAQATHKSETVLTFLEAQLGNRNHFGSDTLTLADITAGTVVPDLAGLAIPLANYPNLSRWVERVTARSSWQQTQPRQEVLEAFMPRMKDLMSAALDLK